jgi:hypothetical protein
VLTLNIRILGMGSFPYLDFLIFYPEKGGRRGFGGDL